MQIYNPVFPDEIMFRLMYSRLTGNQLSLFIPWGVRPGGEICNEETVLDRIVELKDNFESTRIPTRTIIMPADVYAVEVNGLNEQTITEYFSWIADQAYQRGFEVQPWSAIRRENQVQYDMRAQKLSPLALKKLLPPAVIGSALQSATKWNTSATKEGKDASAYAYLRERVCEAEIVEQQWKPIKISLVGKNKDNDVDRDLPRLYVIPQSLQFPWLS